MQAGCHRHKAVIGQDQQIAAPLQHGSGADWAAQLPDAYQRPCSRAGRVGATVDNDFANAGDERQIVIHAIASVERPSVQIDQMPAKLAQGAQVRVLGGAADRASRQIPSLQRVLLDEPNAVLEQRDINQIGR